MGDKDFMLDGDGWAERRSLVRQFISGYGMEKGLAGVADFVMNATGSRLVNKEVSQCPKT